MNGGFVLGRRGFIAALGSGALASLLPWRAGATTASGSRNHGKVWPVEFVTWVTPAYTTVVEPGTK